ncbi:unnamed protein product [Closterium sp. Yama58-4]|nr:unnamed protein product [Closterium sp. Yama58-4]
MIPFLLHSSALCVCLLACVLLCCVHAASPDAHTGSHPPRLSSAYSHPDGDRPVVCDTKRLSKRARIGSAGRSSVASPPPCARADPLALPSLNAPSGSPATAATTPWRQRVRRFPPCEQPLPACESNLSAPLPSQPITPARSSQTLISKASPHGALALPPQGHGRGAQRGEPARGERAQMRQKAGEGRRRLAGLWRGKVWRKARRKAWERRLKQQKPWVRDARRYLHSGDSTGSSTLSTALAYENLTRVNMNPFDKLHPRQGRREVLLGCRGAPCPNMKQCEGHGAQWGASKVHACYDPGVGEETAHAVEAPVNCPRIRAGGEQVRFDPACSHAVDDAAVWLWASQVFEVENVWVNARGQAFNHHLYFDRGGCGSDHQFVHAAGTEVVEYEAVVNLAHWNTWQFYHGLVELLPLFLALRSLRPHIQDVPVALQLLQVEFMEQVGSFVLGLDSIDLNARVIPNHQLFFARRLYQPLYTWCGHPSPSLWHRLRHNHLLPPNGLPLMRPDWSLMRRASSSLAQPTVLDVSYPLPPPADWVVVVARRMGTRALEGFDDMLQGVRGVVQGARGAEVGNAVGRVVVFDGSLDISAGESHAFMCAPASFITMTIPCLPDCLPTASHSSLTHAHACVVLPELCTNAAANLHFFASTMLYRESPHVVDANPSPAPSPAIISFSFHLPYTNLCFECLPWISFFPFPTRASPAPLGGTAYRLFRRTVLLIGVHGAALTNLIFMPRNATLLELRPRGMANACYHHLSSVCSVQYYLLLCDGGKDTPVTCHMDHLMAAVEEAWKGVEETFGL